MGLLPTYFPEQVFVGSLQQEVQCCINFKNPYDTHISFSVLLEKDEHNVFNLFRKVSCVQLQPQSTQ